MRLTRPILLALSAALMAASAGCAGSGDVNVQAGMYAEITNNSGADLTVWGCPGQCGPLGVKIQAGTFAGWDEPRSGVAYTVAIHGKQVACPPVIPRAAGSRGIYFMVQADGKCIVGSRPEGQTTPD